MRLTLELIAAALVVAYADTLWQFAIHWTHEAKRRAREDT